MSSYNNNNENIILELFYKSYGLKQTWVSRCTHSFNQLCLRFLIPEARHGQQLLAHLLLQIRSQTQGPARDVEIWLQFTL